ncbi:MAG: choice-of-anchor E domain-containing protein, partial [Opitutaceae bacterium]
PTFNSNLGTLQAVTLTLDSSFDGSIDFYVPPQAFMPEQYNASTGTNDFVYDSQDNLLTSVLAPGYVSGTTVPGENSAPVSGRASTFAALTPLSSYESAGNGSLTFEVGGDAVGGFEVGPYFGAPELTAYGDLSIAYEYSAIPEPSTYAAVAGITVLGLAVFRRKRQAA